MALSFLKKILTGTDDATESTAVSSAKEKNRRLKVREVIRETPDAVSIVFDHPEEEIIYKSGQYLTLCPVIEGKKLRRAYSLCSSPYTDSYPAVTVKRVEGGVVSGYLNSSVKAGDILEVMDPLGKFTAEPEEGRERHLVLLGGGSGITPLISIAKTILHQEPGSKVSLIYANRNENSIIFRGLLEELKEKFRDRFSLIHVLDEKPVRWECPTGLLEPALLKQLLKQLPESPPAQTEYFICGPEGMMENVILTLQELRIPKEQIHRESFLSGASNKTPRVETPGAADPVAAAGDDVLQEREVTIILDGEEHKFKVSPDKTILETGLDRGLDMPYSCQSGLCTACRGKCLSGKVKLDESEGLSEEELKEGYVLPCVGHPLTDDVIIEID